MTQERPHYFTFGQVHTTTYPLPRGGPLADYYVIVWADPGFTARNLFIKHFTTPFCPHPTQFAFEYSGHFPEKDIYWPHGLLLEIDSCGIIEKFEEGTWDK